MLMIVNAGSSSLKLVFCRGADPVHRETVEEIGTDGHAAALDRALMRSGIAAIALRGAAHRVVHGGPRLTATSRITPAVLDEITAAVPLAPLAGFESLPEATREEIHASAGRMMESSLVSYRAGQAEGSIRPLNTRAILSMLPGVFESLPKWFDSFDSEERGRAPAELAELVRIGLQPI